MQIQSQAWIQSQIQRPSLDLEPDPGPELDLDPDLNLGADPEVDPDDPDQYPHTIPIN